MEIKVLLFYIIIQCLNELIINQAKASTLVSASVDLCGSDNELRLTKSGEASSMTVTLSPNENKGVCKLRVVAPKTHIVNMQFIETITSEIRRALKFNQTTEEHPPCMMNVYLPENPRLPVWKGDPCSGDVLPEVDLLTPDFKIIWNPPTNPRFTNGRKIVITAIGQGQICKEAGQHTCMRIGWNPILCVSNHLLCDGVRNCPSTASNSDEDDKLCKKNYRQPTIEELAVEILKNLDPEADISNTENWLREKLSKQLESSSKKPSRQEPKKTYGNWRKWQEVKREPNITTTTPKPEEKTQKIKTVESLSAALSKYGPWGYLVLGTVICGTVLMFCGLWECCFKKPKNTANTLESQQPTTVLIISQEDTRSNPPNYEELDQPPSYSTLFPIDKVGPASASQNSQSDSGLVSANQVVSVECEQSQQPQTVEVIQTNDNQWNEVSSRPGET